jgi:16S rRNA (guanine966-N2)-methyltransferase
MSKSEPHRTARKPPPRAPNSLRIIAGRWRGRKLQFPRIPGLRPTPDRVRETLFNWLQRSVVGSRCLDLFAGSGALGIEALSRGAREAVFVESDRCAADQLRANLERLGGLTAAHVVQTHALEYLRAAVEPFDLIFLDPPFGQGALAPVIELLASRDWVRPGGYIYLEAERAAGEPVLPARWQRLKAKYAGEVGYHLAQNKPRD